MPLLEPKDVCDLITIEDDTAFRAFAAKNPSGLEMLAEEYGETKQVVLKPDAGDFAKWLRAYDPSVKVALNTKAPILVLRSSDVWLAFAFLANDIALPIYLNLVASYLYEKMKGTLKGETTRVHLCAEYEDKVHGKIKQFSFEGDVEALQKAIKQFDLNKFFDE